MIEDTYEAVLQVKEFRSDVHCTVVEPPDDMLVLNSVCHPIIGWS